MRRSGKSHPVTVCVAALTCVLLARPCQAQSSSRPLSILDVPFISQSEALCGGAAAAMVLRYWGATGLNAESFASLVDRSAAGIRTTTLIGDLRNRGWNATAVAGNEELIATELDRGRPVLTLIEDRPGTFHYVVIVAATPQAIIFHDPARAPFRVMDRERFRQRWSVADRWMAVVVPGGGAGEAASPRDESLPVAETSCAASISAGIRHAQAGELEAAERVLATTLTCGGAAALRELAGVRLLQRRWLEVAELASSAIAVDPGDTYAWQLLATSRFVQNDSVGALEAWNRIDQPHVDLVSVRGLTRTRQPVVERLLNVPAEALLTRQLFDRTERRLQELPSGQAARLEIVPSSSGLAELRAHVVERPVVPTGAWSYAVIGLIAVARREVDYRVGAVTGSGELIEAGWRFWPHRPRASGNVVAPAPWGGLWGVDGFGERQPFAGDILPAARRAGAGLSLASWVKPWARVSGRVGIDHWEDRDQYGVLAGAVRLASRRDTTVVDLDASGWSGRDRFSTFSSSLRLRSKSEHRGLVLVGRFGGALASRSTPPDVWFGGDTGSVRPVLLRAHPIVDAGRLRAERLGRRVAHASVEAQQWWRLKSVIDVGGAMFTDGARVGRQLADGARSDVDVGTGVRVALPGIDGIFRLDVAKGLRDGATAVSFVYEP